MSDLATWANAAEIIGGIAVLGGVVFAVVEIRRGRQSKVDLMAMEVRSTFFQAEYIEAAVAVTMLGPNTDPDIIRSDPEIARAASIVATAQHSLGAGIYLGTFPLTDTYSQDPWHSWHMWRCLHLWIKDARRRAPSAFWGFEWLIGKCQAERVLPAEPVASREPYHAGDMPARYAQELA